MVLNLPQVHLFVDVHVPNEDFRKLVTYKAKGQHVDWNIEHNKFNFSNSFN